MGDQHALVLRQQAQLGGQQQHRRIGAVLRQPQRIVFGVGTGHVLLVQAHRRFQISRLQRQQLQPMAACGIAGQAHQR